MKREPPKVDTRRAADFRGELLARARAWIHDWALDEPMGDFGAALVDVAARFSAQVAERLDRASDKLSLGLLDWLAVRGKAARPARMPVAFKLADTARAPVLAPRGTRLQADVDGASVTFETEDDVNLVPGTLAQLVGVDSEADAYFLPPPGISSLEPLEPLPSRWTLKNFADQGATKLQLDPALGLEAGTLIEIAGHQYRVQNAEGDLVEIEPGVQSVGGLSLPMEATRVENFDPFGGTAQNQQEHIVYLGDKDLFNVEAAATFEVLGTNNTLGEANWQYFGKSATEDEAKWRDLTLAHEAEQMPGALKLLKPAGAIEPTDLSNIKGARWIRARQIRVVDESRVLLTDALSVIVNRGKNLAECPPPGQNADSGAPAEGFINSTALVLSSVFYPLGKQPKQFDTFYLGCTDAFSKGKAEVSVCFEMADPSPASFAAVLTGAAANRVLVSAGADGALHIFGADPVTGALSDFRGRGPLQPKDDAGAVALDPKPGYRLPVWTDDNNPKVSNPFAFFFPGGLGRATFSVAVSAGNSVWVWREAYYWPLSSQWISYQALPRSSATANATIDALAYLPGPSVTDAELYAAFDGKLFRHSALEDRASEAWAEVTLTGDFTAGDQVRSISPVFVLDGALPTAARGSGLVAVFEHTDGTFGAYIIELLEDPQERGVCVVVESPTTVVADTQPTGGRIVDDYCVFWHLNDPAAVPPPAAQVRSATMTRTVAMNVSTWSAVTLSTDDPSDDPNAAIAGGSFDIQKLDGQAALIVVTRNSDQSTLTSLAPFAPAASTASFEAPLPAGSGPLAGAATVFGNFIVAPGAQSDAWLGAWDPGSRQNITVTLETGIIVPTASQPLAAGDYIAIATSLTAQEHTTVDDFGTVSGDERLYTLQSDIGINLAGTQPPLLAFRVVSANGTTPNPGNRVYTSGAVTAGGMTLDGADRVVQQGEWLLIQDAVSGFMFRQVNVVTTAVGAWSVTLLPNVGLTPTGSVAYWHSDTLPGRVAPFFALDPNGNGNWNASRLDQASLVFDTGNPARQHGRAFRVDVLKRPEIVVLDQRWIVKPGTGDFYIDSSISSWQQQLGDSTSNPELGWEYWNGTNWTQLVLKRDETLNFKQTGRLDFTVPLNLAATDVAGKTNYWIRARLVGGDYGQEKVKVITKPVGTDGTTEQTVERSPADIRPPLVVRMRVRYALSAAVLPAYLVTQDSGSQRNQSDANRTLDAKVEAFIPLSLLMKRLAPAPGIESPGTGTTPPPAAHCGSGPAAPPPRKPEAEACCAESAEPQADSKEAATAADNRGVLLGFDAGLQGEPVNVLLLVEERPHDGFAPLAVEALTRDRFEALTVKDTTRALGESGLLSMSFAVKPSPRDLFGRTLTWLRLHPSRDDPNGDWLPNIRGAYLNSAWAKATETLTREPLGSSDGRPQLTLNVARPPLLADTLELRVREPLDQEERQALLDADSPGDADSRSVKFDLPELPGDWVLWRQVADPADWGPRERVYALDETSGEVQFGDGIHGVIPPIGRDAIVAFKYQRTEPAADGGDAVPANAVESRTALNLITPVESVEAAFSAEHAAGGSPPENTARVLRFGTQRLRHRGRAIVLRDFEDLALASSPDIAQAHAFRRASGLRIVVVMQGKNPLPTSVQRRALHRLLLESATPVLGEDAALAVEGPRLRRLRVHLQLNVASLDDAGDTAGAVKKALQEFFDPVHGGVDGDGWSLGAAPTDDDIAFALADARGLEGIANIAFSEVSMDGSEQPWRPAVRASELVMLADDGVRIHFETLETEA